MSFFGGSPFSTQVGQRIEQATDATLGSENWALMMEICDIINETDEGPKDAIKAIKRRLQTKGNHKVLMLTLTVLETCVKNCGHRFHVLVANKDFVNEMVKIIQPKNNPSTTLQERVLSLIQTMSDAFRNYPDLQGVVQVHEELRSKGVEFPMTDLDNLAPIHTPERSVPPDLDPAIARTRPASVTAAPAQRPAPQAQQQPPQQGGQQNPPGSPGAIGALQGPINPTPEQLGKLRSELDVVEGNTKVMSEMLTEMTPGQEDPADLELLHELNRTCHAMQQRIVELIDKVANEEVTGELLRINDDLNNVFLRFERFERYRTGKTGQPSTATPAVAATAGGPTTVTGGAPPVNAAPMGSFPPPPSYREQSPTPPPVASTASYPVPAAAVAPVAPARQDVPLNIPFPPAHTQDPNTTPLMGTLDSLNPPPTYTESQSAEPQTDTLIDLGPDVSPGGPPPLQPTAAGLQQQLAGLSLTSSSISSTLNATPTVTAQNTAGKDDDEFDMFAQTRGKSMEESRRGGSTYEDISHSGDLMSGGLARAVNTKSNPNQPHAQPLDEVEKWLEQSDLPPLQTGEQAASRALPQSLVRHGLQSPGAAQPQEEDVEPVTSAEFDRFLEERAKAADTLPDLNSLPEVPAHPINPTSTGAPAPAIPPRRGRQMQMEESENTLFGL
ncbi:PREDICTED: TOM1-like protein 2 isoform X2 [Branchiostoma belcheri]|uniref:TOM1-like protein 2 isoform X2 n=1 Tax=Branchiostoma belcheri TaxID=7741 RepID=A0A6P4ZE58_BRABE|nr:PREDICTED: TOM1-like protein 2 isoform X2 [Branchiostoma belcheri]